MTNATESIHDSIKEASNKRASTIKIIKVAVLAVLSLLLSGIVWRLMDIALYGHKPLIFWAWVVVAMMFWIVFSSLFAMVNPYRWLMAVVTVWNLVLYLSILPKEMYVIFGGILFFLLSILFLQRISVEEKNQLHFSVRRTISSSLIIATYAFLTVVGFNIYHNTSQDFKDNPQKFYDALGQAVAKGIPVISENISSGVNLNQSLDSYLTEQAESQLPDDMDNLPQSQRNEFIEKYRGQFLRQFHLDDSASSQTLAAAISQIINEKTKEVLGRFERFFPLIFTLVVLALLRTFAFVFNWLTILLAWIVFKVMRAVKFFKLSKTTVEVEHLDV